MPDTWSQFTDADVLGEFTSIEKATLLNVRQGSDNLPGIVARVVEEIRKAYRDGGRDVDTVAGTIPEGEKPRAIAIARWKLLISYPQMKAFQTADRKAAHDEAETYLKSIAMREQKGEGGAEIVSSQTRKATRTKMDGLT